MARGSHTQREIKGGRREERKRGRRRSRKKRTFSQFLRAQGLLEKAIRS